MATIRKIQPVGIDRVIDHLQTKLEGLGWSKYQIYPRAYKNETEAGIIAENYIGKGQYDEVFFDDNFDATSFFVTNDSNPVQGLGQQVSGELSIIFQVKLDKQKPNIVHRADEEIRYDVVLAVRENKYSWDVVNISTGISNVYAGFVTDKLKWDDMSNYHVFKIDMEGTYQVDCKVNTSGT